MSFGSSVVYLIQLNNNACDFFTQIHHTYSTYSLPVLIKADRHSVTRVVLIKVELFLIHGLLGSNFCL